MNRNDFEKLFKPKQQIESGANPGRKNATRLEIVAIEDDCVRYRSITSQEKVVRSLTYSVLSRLVKKFEEIDKSSIQKSVNGLLKEAKLPIDHVTETYAYAFARAYRIKVDMDSPETSDSEELPSTRQGFQLFPGKRKAIEEHAMELARKHFRSEGYKVKTHGKPFDLLCTRRGKTLYVEVKGTQGAGAEILLTRGEVNFHRANPGAMALFVVSGIEIKPDGQASGGTSHVKSRWIIRENSLTPYAFSYRI